MRILKLLLLGCALTLIGYKPPSLSIFLLQELSVTWRISNLTYHLDIKIEINKNSYDKPNYHTNSFIYFLAN